MTRDNRTLLTSDSLGWVTGGSGTMPVRSISTVEGRKTMYEGFFLPVMQGAPRCGEVVRIAHAG